MAIVTFKSNAAGEIYMFRETAEKVFKVIGKPLGIRGVLTPEELPAAIAALKTEMEKEKEYLKAVREREDKLFKEGKDLDEEKKPSIEQPVYFTQRAYPLLEMFELSSHRNDEGPLAGEKCSVWTLCCHYQTQRIELSGYRQVLS